MKERTVTGGGLVAVASVLFGIVVVLGAGLVRDGLSVASMLAIRFAVAALLLAAIAMLRGLSPLPVPGERVPLALLGLAGYSIEASLFFAGINHGTATAVTLLFFVYPVFIAVTSAAMGRGLPGRLVGAALVAAVAGAAIVVATGGRVAIRPLGIVLALGSAVTFTIYLIGAERAMRHTDAGVASAWVGAWASAGLFASMTIQAGRHLPAGSEEWVRVVAMGIATGGAFVCLMAGLRLIGPVRTSIVAALEPLSSAVLATIFLHEPLRAGMASGGVLIIGGAVTASLARRRAEPEIPVR